MFLSKKRQLKLKKSDANGMRAVGSLVGETLQFISQYVTPGISTNELDQLVHDFTLKRKAKPAPLGYKGFPKSICTSLNDCLCHGVPDDTVLKSGDIINIDITTILDGYHGDASFTFPVGRVSSEHLELCKAAKKARDEGIKAITPGVRTGTIGAATEAFVSTTPFHLCKEIGGHGIGKVFHTDPFIPAFGTIGEGDKVKPWTCITVEPIINLSSAPMKEFHIPNSSIRYYHTRDRSFSAQYEHTILVTDSGYEILTDWQAPVLE